MRSNWLIPLFLMIAGVLTGQEITISGNVSDAETGEDLIGATVFSSATGKGVTTNVYGFYSLTVPSGSLRLEFSYLGYQSRILNFFASQDSSLNVDLSVAGETLAEIVVVATDSSRNLSENRGSVTTLSVKDIETVPVLMGEKDVMKVLQLTPGIKSAGEGNSGFYVRGGGLDQNLILLDEAPVYNPSHLLGFFSVFNSDALKNVTAYKGGIPAEYGGRTASVLDIRMKDGNDRQFSGSGGIGLISSRLTLEGPLKKDVGAFMVSGRRTYADLFLGLSGNEDLADTKLYFYDLNAKANYRLGKKDRIYLSAYTGRDNFGFGDNFGFDWGNLTGTLRWNHVFGNKLFSNTSLIYSNYDYEFGIGAGEDKIGLQSVIEDFNLRQDFSLYTDRLGTVKFGLNLIDHTIEPGNLVTGEESGVTADDIREQKGLEGAVYLAHNLDFGDRWNLNYGLRYSFFNYQGDESSGESDATYGGLEPRLSLAYQLNRNTALKANYHRAYQYMHLLSNATSSTPTDAWILSNDAIEPQVADQVSLGYFRNFANNTYELSVEAYYKDMSGVIDYRNGADIFFNEKVEDELVYGGGRAYGVEFYARKTKGQITGWLSYTLSRSLRQFDDIDDGREFSARQDRIHDLALVIQYKINPKISLSANFVYNTGDAVTFPSGRYEVEGTVVPYYTERNGYRFPDYHRLDIGLTWYRKKTKRFESNWNFSIYNVYGRENAYSITFEPDEDDPNVTNAVQLALFRAIPSFSYNFKF